MTDIFKFDWFDSEEERHNEASREGQVAANNESTFEGIMHDIVDIVSTACPIPETEEDKIRERSYHHQRDENFRESPITEHYNEPMSPRPVVTASSASDGDAGYERVAPNKTTDSSGAIAVGFVICLLLFLGSLSRIVNWTARPSQVNTGVIETPRAQLQTQSGPHFGATAVWNTPQTVWERMQDECRPANSSTALAACVTAIMKENGASPEAIAFARLLGGEGYMTNYRQIGILALATAFLPFRANDNESYYIVNGTPPLINPDDLAVNIDIRPDPLYPSLIQQYPNLMLWGGHTDFQSSEQTTTGQRLIFSMPLLNGCHACEVGGGALIGLDFDASGRLADSRLLELKPNVVPKEPIEAPAAQAGNSLPP